MGEHSKDSPGVSAAKDITAGMFRGVAQVVVGHPLDTIKVRLQTQSHIHPEYHGVMDCFYKTTKHEGYVLGLYKGASSPLAMAAAAVLFLAYGQSKRLVQSSNGDPLTFQQQLLAGMMTGGMASFAESPMDLFKCKMQVQKAGVSHDPFVYKNAMDAGYKIVQHYGIRGAYRGVDATIMRNVPGSAVYFLVYETLKQKLGANSQLSIMTAGGIGGVAFWLSIYPIDVLKSKLQSDSIDKSQQKYSNVFDCARKVYQAQGLKAFWKGFGACLIRAFPVNACSFLTYEYVRSKLS